MKLNLKFTRGQYKDCATLDFSEASSIKYSVFMFHFSDLLCFCVYSYGRPQDEIFWHNPTRYVIHITQYSKYHEKVVF